VSVITLEVVNYAVTGQ